MTPAASPSLDFPPGAGWVKGSCNEETKSDSGRISIATTSKGRQDAEAALGAEGTWMKTLDLTLAELQAVQEEEEEGRLLRSKGSEENRAV